MIFDFLQLLGGFILSFGWIPQIIQIIKTRSVHDLNPRTFVFLFTGILLMEVYGIHLALEGTAIAFLITNTMSLILILIILVLLIHFRKSRFK